MQTFQTSLALESGVARLTNETTEFSYRVVYPLSYALLRVLFAAGCGALVFGIPRILLAVMGQPRPIRLLHPNFAGGWSALTSGQFPLVNFVIALLILGASIFIGLRYWFHVFRRSEI